MAKSDADEYDGRAFILQVEELQENREEAYRTFRDTFSRLCKEKRSREEWFQIASIMLLELRGELSLELHACTEVLLLLSLTSKSESNFDWRREHRIEPFLVAVAV